MKRALVIILVNLVVLALLLAAVEVVLRAGDWRPAGTFTSVRYDNDPQAGPWALPSQVAFAQSPCFRVDGIHINSFGMRDRERQLASPGARIAVIGDSFTQGLQVADEHVVSRQLERLLNGRAEVLNFGVSSTGTAVQLLNYRARVKPFKPDAVLLLFFAGNDASDNLRVLKQQGDPAMADISPYLTLDEHGALREEPQPGTARRTSWLASEISRLRAGQWAYRGFINMRYVIFPFREPVVSASEEAKAWTITEQVLTRFGREVRADGGAFAVAIIPDRFALGPSARAARLMEVAAHEGFSALDMAPIFAQAVAAQGRDQIYYGCDGHWTPAGHTIAARALKQFADNQHWLDGQSGERP